MSVQGLTPCLLACGPQASDVVGCHFEPLRRQGFQIFDNGLETAHAFKVPRLNPLGNKSRQQFFSHNFNLEKLRLDSVTYKIWRHVSRLLPC